MLAGTLAVLLVVGCGKSDSAATPSPGSTKPKSGPAAGPAIGPQQGPVLSHRPSPSKVEPANRSGIFFPPEVGNPPWLEKRRRDQLSTAEKFDVFHEFGFENRTPESGITFRNRIVEDVGKYYISVHYDHGNGVAVGDVDGDGLGDIYFTTQLGSNELWRNLGEGKFENITAAAGVGVADLISVTASFADTDNDGDVDLFVTTVRGGNLLFENDGTGKFQDISKAAGLDYVGHSSGAVFFDYDRDGNIDLFLANVGVYTKDEKGPGGEYKGFADAFSGHLKPERFERSILYRNLGDNRFEDVTEAVGLVDNSWTGDASPIDANHDGWPDLYLLDMQGHDEYYENVEGRKFVKKSREVFPKTPWGAMGVKAFDYNNDGLLDLFVSDMHSDMFTDVGPEGEKLKSEVTFPESYLQSGKNSIFGNAFYECVGPNQYREVSDRIGAENYWPWGLSVGDLNADGYQDVFVSSSMNYPFRYGVNTVLLNNLGKRFLDSEFILGVEPRRNDETAAAWFDVDFDNDTFAGQQKDVFEQARGQISGKITIWGALGTRASVIFDLDNDGDLDIVTNDFNTAPLVLVSDLSDKKEINYVKVELVGTNSNRNGLGARVTVRTETASYVQVQDGQSGYLSQSQLPLYFGLGDTDQVREIEVAWPSGHVQKFDSPQPENGVVRLTEKTPGA